jgi:2-methylene-furan-3-one reductase
MQKAWFYNEYGSIDVLQFGEFPVPKPGPGEILLKIRAAALNPVDYQKREGLFRSADCDFPVFTVLCYFFLTEATFRSMG